MTDSPEATLFKDVPQVDPEKNYLEDLVGEGKKFKDERELARAKVESDAFITRLQGELQGLREDLTKRASIEDFLDQMKSLNERPGVEPNRPNHGEEDEHKTHSGPSQEDLEKLIEQKVSQLEKINKAQENFNLVRQKMQELWGEDYPQRLAAKARELGLGESFLNNLAREQPKAFLKLVDVAQDKAPDLFNRRSSVDSSKLLSQQGTSSETYSYFEKMRTENPKEYWNPRTQNQMFKLAKENPDKFFDK